jgi:hypothetical protein
MQWGKLSFDNHAGVHLVLLVTLGKWRAVRNCQRMQLVERPHGDAPVLVELHQQASHSVPGTASGTWGVTYNAHADQQVTSLCVCSALVEEHTDYNTGM